MRMQTRKQLAELTFVHFAEGYLKQTIKRNPDGTIDESVKSGVDYTACVHIFDLTRPEEVDAYRKGLTPHERVRYDSYSVNALVKRRNMCGW